MPDASAGKGFGYAGAVGYAPVLEGADEAQCPFCARLAAGEVVLRGQAAAVIPDARPRSPGHVLVVPLAHLEDFFSVPTDTVNEMLHLLRRVQQRMAAQERPPLGWTVRVNVGEAAGQTAFHTHVHLVPRYADDRDSVGDTTRGTDRS